MTTLMNSTLKTIKDAIALVVFFPVGLLLFVCIVLLLLLRAIAQYSIEVFSTLATSVVSFFNSRNSSNEPNDSNDFNKEK